MSNWKNIHSILNSGNIPFKSEHWQNLSNRLDKIQLSENKIREKLNENPDLRAPENLWNNIAHKIDAKSFTKSDYKIREILSSGFKKYQRKHWLAFLTLFYVNKFWVKKWLIASFGLAVSIIGFAVWHMDFLPNKTISQKTNLVNNKIHALNDNKDKLKKSFLIQSNYIHNEQKQLNNIKDKNLLILSDYTNQKSNHSNTLLSYNHSKKVDSNFNISKYNENLNSTILDKELEIEFLDMQLDKSQINNFLSTTEKFPNNLSKVDGLSNKLLSSISFNNYPTKLHLEYEAPILNKTSYHIGYLQILNPFQNAHQSGFFGKNNLTISSAISWERILVENSFNSFKLLYPTNNNVHFSNQINNNLSVGINYQNKLTQNWLGQIVGIALSYNKNIGAGNFRIGLGSNMHQEQIIADNLSYREQLALTNEINFTEVRNGKLRPLQKNSLNFSVGYFRDNFFVEFMQWERVMWISNAIQSDYTYQKIQLGYNFNEFKNIRSTLFGGVVNDFENNYFLGTSIAYKNKIAFNTFIIPYEITELSIIAKFKNIRSSIFWRSDLYNQIYSLSDLSIYTGATGINLYWVW